MKTETFPAMGTTFQVRADGSRDVVEVKRRVSAYEQRFSRFLEYSELSHINRHPSVWQRVSDDMAAVLGEASAGETRSDGCFDIGVGASVVAWGYDRSFTLLPNRLIATETPHGRGTWRFDDGLVWLDEGTTLDLGGIVKGWVCDQIVSEGIAVMLSAGGDIRSASDQTDVQLFDAAGRSYADVPLGIGGLATSSIAKRTWETNRGLANHLIDPHTGKPSPSPVIQATVIAETCTAAEIGAKTVILKGVDGLAWADQQPWIKQVIALWHDGSVYATNKRAVA